MRINEMRQRTGLTKKAIEYYTLCGFVTPTISDNGYRAFCEQDVIVLNKVSMFRKLDISIEEIKKILRDKTNSALQTVWIKKELAFQRDVMKMAILEKLISGSDDYACKTELQTIETNKTIGEKLLDAFPGYYGRFLCLHFARFLNEPVLSETQQRAYEIIISFLDNAPALDLPQGLEDYLTESTNHLGPAEIHTILETTKNSFENPAAYLAENQEFIEQYLAYKQSAEYQDSMACKLLKYLEQFHRTSGYYDVFLPAMKQLSNAYCHYIDQMELANEKLFAQYPAIEKLYG